MLPRFVCGCLLALRFLLGGCHSARHRLHCVLDCQLDSLHLTHFHAMSNRPEEAAEADTGHQGLQ